MASGRMDSCRPLRRGKACLNCRHLKIKCNGARPVCSSCIRVPKDDPCEYTDTMSRTQKLEHTVSRLQMRLKDLQNTEMPSKYRGTQKLLSASYTPSARRSSCSGSSSSSDTGSTIPNLMPHSWRASLCPEIVFPSSLGDPPGSFDSGEPTSATAKLLLESFRPHTTQFGVFLDPTRFEDVVLGPAPVVSSALLDAVFLCGAHLSHTDSLLVWEAVFLRRARQHIATEISADMDLAHHMHTIQALVLLSTYLLRTKRFLEAEFYTNGAATLVLGHQLHRISVLPETSSVLGLSNMKDIKMYTASVHAVEEGERIRAFWAVACLQTHLNFTINIARSAFGILEFALDEIDIPWPFKIDDYRPGFPLPAHSTQHSILHLLSEDCPPNSPRLCILHSKASLLLHHTTRLGTAWPLDLESQDSAAYMTAYHLLDRRITEFWKSLPPICAHSGDEAASRMLAVTHAVTAAAAIRLHRCPSGVAGAQAKCLFAARAILDSLRAVTRSRPQSPVVLHPVVGALCSLACGVLIEEVKYARLFSVPGEKDFGLEEADLSALLRAGMTTMAVCAQACPLIQYQLHKLRQQTEMM
ncbi:hypothetical protein K438DRAFT_2029784 [Mycena galopus ATCC 62051]|nr:hypothetical protein K438DRAFT_2029784 [Mycena galopus ATCC 62051]